MSNPNHPSAANMARTVVNIDRLVLRGVDPHDVEALTESLKLYLARTLSDSAGAEPPLGALNTPVLRLGRIPLATGRAGARDFGAKVARAIGVHVRRNGGSR